MWSEKCGNFFCVGWQFFAIFASNIYEATRFVTMKNTKLQADFLAMLDRCEGIIYGVCLHFTDHSRDSVDDLYQEIVCQLWKGYKAFREESKESTWVWRVALNAALQQRRHSKDEPPMVGLDSSIFDTVAEASPDPLLERLYELVDMLPPHDKQLAELYLRGESVKRMAQILKCTENVVNKRIQKLKRTLKAMNDRVK